VERHLVAVHPQPAGRGSPAEMTAINHNLISLDQPMESMNNIVGGRGEGRGKRGGEGREKRGKLLIGKSCQKSWG